MRALALLLILANIGFFFWAHYIDVPEAGPLAASVPESRRPPRLLLAKEKPQDAAAASSASSRAELLATQLTCISVGPFHADNEQEQVTRRLQDAGFSVSPRNEQGEVFAGYWVSLPGFASRADAQQALQRLHAGGVTDAYILPDDGAPIVLSLGLFSEQARAEQRRDAIAKLGFQPQLQTRTRSGAVHWLDVTLQEPGQLIDPGLLQPESGGIVRLETTACPTSSETSSEQSASSQSSSSSQASSANARKAVR